MFKLLFSNANMYFYISLISICSILFVHNQFLKKDIEYLNYQIEIYTNKMLDLEKETKAYEDKVLSASNIAAIEVQKDAEEANLILTEEVSSDCNKAIEWAIERAISL